MIFLKFARAVSNSFALDYKKLMNNESNKQIKKQISINQCDSETVPTATGGIFKQSQSLELFCHR